MADRAGIDLLELEIAFDHVHLLLRANGRRELPSAMHQLKGATARSVFQRYPELKIDMGSNSFWQKGYGWKGVIQSQAKGLRDYIRTQALRPLWRDAT